MPYLGAEKAVRAPAHFAAAVERALILDPVQVIAHNRGVIRPPLLGRTDFVVPVKKSDPFAAAIPTGNADQLRAEPRDNEANSVFVVCQHIEQTVAPFLFATGELHGCGIGCRPQATPRGPSTTLRMTLFFGPPLQITGTTRGRASLS